MKKILRKWPALLGLYEKYEEIILYLIIGVLTTLVSWCAKFLFNFIFYANTPFPTPSQNLVLSMVNWVSGVIFAFFTNRAIVFKSEGAMVQEAVRFVLSRISTLFLDMAMMQLLSNVCGLNLFAATMIAEALVVIANYFLSKLLVFRKK